MKDTLIPDLVRRAADTGATGDYDELFAKLPGVELFFNVSTEAEGGVDRAAVSTPLVDAGPGLSAVLLFTSNDNPQLKRPFGGIAWERALEMVAGMPKADGLILQNNDAAWVGIDKAKVHALMETLR